MSRLTKCVQLCSCHLSRGHTILTIREDSVSPALEFLSFYVSTVSGSIHRRLFLKQTDHNRLPAMHMFCVPVAYMLLHLIGFVSTANFCVTCQF
jgi:hypothetical protein